MPCEIECTPQHLSRFILCAHTLPCIDFQSLSLSSLAFHGNGACFDQEFLPKDMFTRLFIRAACRESLAQVGCEVSSTSIRLSVVLLRLHTRQQRKLWPEQRMKHRRWPRQHRPRQQGRLVRAAKYCGPRSTWMMRFGGRMTWRP